ncbi:MAG: OprO/OprP family phosphate-selective porin [Candidatus Thiodiazotropha sp. (ex Monitilora ramsayi)]|nr:OprO/OprP family phosphate-selective porin [Candidatus Thiodiazotropha sp. (ex Monitilora ramsayi)]
MSKYGKLPLNRASTYYLILLASLLGTQQSALASKLPENHFQIHGFLTQAYVKTTDNRFFGDSQDGSFDFREIGANASYRFNPKLMASAQLLSRVAGDMYNGSLTVDYAQLDYTFHMSERARYGALLGRTKNPLGFYNDTRDVAATRPGIFMPQAIYWDRVRNMVLSNDGVQFYADNSNGLHRFSLQLLAGKTPIDENVEKSYLDPSLNASMDQDGVTTGGRLLYEWDGGRLRLALSNAMLKLDSRTTILPPGSIDIDYWVLSAQYNHGPWRLTAEYMEEPIDYQGFANLLDSADTTVDGYYLQGDYRLHSDWELLLRYEQSHYDKDDRYGSKVSTISGLPPYNFYSKLWTAGLLWEPTEQLMLRAEFSQVEGVIFLSNLENPIPSERVKDWNLFSLLISYSF